MSDQVVQSPEFLTVRELAELLRIKERKVYDLVAAGEVPVSRVTGKLLFPEREVRAWIAGASSGREVHAAPLPGIVLGSHDPLLEWALRQSHSGLAASFDGSHDGLRRFVAQGGVAAGLHILEEGGRWNVSAVSEVCRGRNVALVAFAVRARGLVLRREDAAHVATLADIAGRRVVPRQAESGAQVMFEALLADANLGHTDIARTEPAPSETEAVLAVARGAADVAFGLQALAEANGLAFVPVAQECYDLLVDRAAWFDPPMQRFLDFCTGDSFARHAAEQAGYDVTDLGRVRWNA